MSKMELGFLLAFSPFFLLALIMIIIEHVDAWNKAINHYKEYNDKSGLILVTILTVFEIMFLTGVYLILTK